MEVINVEAVNNIKNYLDNKDINYKLHNYDTHNNSNYDIDKCYKTIAFEYEQEYIFVCLKIIDKIDYNKLCSKLGLKRERLKKANIDKLNNLFGYEFDGIAPIPISNQISIFIDEKIRFEDIIFCGSGNKNVILEIKGKDLIELSKGVFNIIKQ